MIQENCPEIILRALEPEDLDLFYTIENDPQIWEVSNTCTPISRYAIKQYLALQPQEVFQAGELRLVIEDLRHQAVGLLDLTSISILDGRAEVGIAILKEQRGKGYGLAALRKLTRYAKVKLRLRFLFAQMGVDSGKKSISIFESNGYRRVALLPKWHHGDNGIEDVVIYQKIL